MIFTYPKHKTSKRIYWKPDDRKMVVPQNSRPITNKSTPTESAAFMSPHGKARPLKQYRKQLQPYYSNKSSKVDLSRVNVPNGAIKTSNACNVAENIIQEYIVPQSPVCLDMECSVKENDKSKIRRSASTVIDRNYHSSTSSYLKSKCRSYSQKSMPSKVKDESKNSYYMTNCSNDKCSTIHDLNNKKYYCQGAVSSSNRLLRLKNETINKNAASLKSKYGDYTSNACNYANNVQYSEIYIKKDNDNSNQCREKIVYPQNFSRGKTGKRSLCK